VNSRNPNAATARPIVEPKRPATRPHDPPKPKLQVVPTSVRAKRRRASVLGLFACALVFGFMIGLTAFQAQLAQNQIEVDSVQRELQTEQLRFDRARLEVARLQAPKNILARAEKLGMKASVDNVYLPPSQAVVTEVLVAAAGGPEAQVTSASETRPDWSTYKKTMGATP
jgi:cell division protein FtsL